MKKIYPLIFLFLLCENIEAQTNIDLLPTDNLATTIAGLTIGTYVINLPAGSIYSGAGTTITVPLNVNISINGPSTGTKPIIQYKLFDVADNNSTAIAFANIELISGTGTSDYYLFNFGSTKVCTITKIEFKNCIIRDYERSFIRTQGTSTVINEVIVDNCIVKNIVTESGAGYAFLNGAGEVKKITVKNSTFTNLPRGFIDLKNVGADEINILDCTFDNNIEDTRSLLNLQSSINKTTLALNVSNTIFGSSKPGTVKAVNNAASATYIITQTVTNSYKTTDWVILTGYDFTNLTAYTGSSTDLFTNTSTLDFTFKDASFAGKSTTGDPRWRSSSEISNDATLSALTLSAGTLNPEFAPTTLAYAVVLPYGTTAIPTLTASTTNAKATKVITPATNLTGTEAERTATAIVTAEDGINTKTYSVLFSVSKSNDATLSTLTVSIGTLNPIFDVTTHEYSVLLPIGTTLVPSVSATTSDAHATKVITNAVNLSGTENERTATIIVTAEDGITTITYAIVFSVAKNNDASLSTLSVSAGTLNPVFTAAILAYNVVLPYSTTAVPTVTAATSDANATMVITTAINVIGTTTERTATVVVTAEDGTTKITYSVVFSVAKNNDATLSALSVSVGTINPTFAATTLAYTVTLPSATTTIPAVSATTTDGNATKVITPAANLTGTINERTTIVVVTAEDGSTTITYTLLFTVLTSIDNNSIENRIKLYPNPVSEFFNLEIDADFTELPKVIISNSLGQIVLEQKLDQIRSSISIESLNEGIYHVVLVSKGKVNWRGSFIKIK